MSTATSNWILKYCLMVFWLFLLLCQLFDVTALPVSNNGDLKRGATNLSTYEKQLEDEEVRELQSLKPSANTVSVAKSEKITFSEENGKKTSHREFKEQVNKGGEMLERVQQKMDMNQQSQSSLPETHLLTEYEVPTKNIHKIIEQSSGDQNEEDQNTKTSQKRKSLFRNSRQMMENLIDEYNSKNTVLYTPLEMAEYIYATGDEKTVTLAVENYLQNELLDRESAINYLQDIKTALNAFELRGIQEQARRYKKNEPQSVYEKVFDYPRSRAEVTEALSDLREIQQLLQNKYMKSFPASDETADQSYKYHRERDEDENEIQNYQLENDNRIRLTEKDYQTLIEKLQIFENLFSEASMEEVIYELAKVLFSQSFTLGGSEVQDALKKFTTFLETQVEEGHISRNMERKVLDILITALADVLNEHPEFVNSTRQKLDEANRQLEERKFRLNRIAVEKKDVSSKQNILSSLKKTDMVKKASTRFSSFAEKLNNDVKLRTHMK